MQETTLSMIMMHIVSKTWKAVRMLEMVQTQRKFGQITNIKALWKKTMILCYNKKKKLNIKITTLSPLLDLD